MATQSKPKAGKAKPVAKAAKKTSSKSAAKPAGKAAAKSAQADKSAAKATKAKSKVDLKPKAAPGKAAAKSAPKANAKSAAKSDTKVPAKPVDVKSAKKPAAKDAKPVKATVIEKDEAEELVEAADLDLAEDLEGDDVSAGAPVEQPSALLQAMRPNPPGSDKPERRKKRDELKIDRNGDIPAQWNQLKEKYKALKAVPYKMTDVFEARTPIQHKTLGWGFVISNLNNRLEVIFENEIKMLISNYKA